MGAKGSLIKVLGLASFLYFNSLFTSSAVYSFPDKHISHKEEIKTATGLRVPQDSLEDKIEAHPRIRIAINPGHFSFSHDDNFGAEDRANGNYEIFSNMLVAQKLHELLDKDYRFESEVIKDTFSYSSRFVELITLNKGLFTDLFPGAIPKDYAVDYSQYSAAQRDSILKERIETHNLKEEFRHNISRIHMENFYMNFYFDEAVHIHHDASGRPDMLMPDNTLQYPDSGYLVCIGSNMKSYNESRRAAIEVSRELSKIRNQGTTLENFRISLLDKYKNNKKKQTEIENLASEGVIYRDVAQFSSKYDDEFNNAQIPTILVECEHEKHLIEYMKKGDFRLRKYAEETAYSIYKGILNAHSLPEINWRISYDEIKPLPMQPIEPRTLESRTFINAELSPK